MIDPQLAYDAAQFRLLLESSMWEVLKRHIEQSREDCLGRMTNYLRPDQETHHWRGGYAALTELLTRPERVIEDEKRQRK